LPPPNTWSAYPFPSTIMLYKEGQGYPKFDPVKAKTYFTKVNDKIARLIQETIGKWDMDGVREQSWIPRVVEAAVAAAILGPAGHNLASELLAFCQLHR